MSEKMEGEFLYLGRRGETKKNQRDAWVLLPIGWRVGPLDVSALKQLSFTVNTKSPVIKGTTPGAVFQFNYEDKGDGGYAVYFGGSYAAFVTRYSVGAQIEVWAALDRASRAAVANEAHIKKELSADALAACLLPVRIAFRKLGPAGRSALLAFVIEYVTGY